MRKRRIFILKAFATGVLLFIISVKIGVDHYPEHVTLVLGLSLALKFGIIFSMILWKFRKDIQNKLKN